MKEDELLALLRLQITPGVGPVNSRKLIGHFRSATTIFRESRNALLRIPGIGTETVRNLLDNKFQQQAEKELKHMQQNGVRCLASGEPGYPHLLKQCADAPLLLFWKGAFSFDGKRFISIVGTRNMTSRGRSFCERFLKELAPFRPVVVSGLASGVDICAHRVALEQGLQTVACLAHGLDLVYPQIHARYISKIMDQGGLLSEFWLGTSPEPMNFVKRNRIIAGLSEATVVVESAIKGGSLITADLAFGYNREVFSVPGRPGDVFSQGCNVLIRDQKAQLLQNAEEFVTAMNWDSGRATEPSVTSRQIIPEDLQGAEKSVADFLKGRGEQLLDDIACGCHLPVKAVAPALFQLEMKGLVTPLPGKRYQLKEY
ncbi:MAG: DNA-processing protein DprA [Robiginitalea sp.]